MLHFLRSTHSPLQIGLMTREEGRLVYDFKTGQVTDQRQGNSARLSESADDPLSRRGLALIKEWEYLRYTEER